MVNRDTMDLTQPSVTLTLLAKLTMKIWNSRNYSGIILTYMMK